MRKRFWGDRDDVLANGAPATPATHDRTQTVESFVTAQEAADFLAITKRRILELARQGNGEV